ncbi:MAG: rod shape-determining protein RodA [Clostridia bacterium]|jgi:rod shape determining protein RodA
MYFIEKSKGPNPFKLFDYHLFFAILMLSAIGLIVLRSATANLTGGSSVLTKQIVFFAIGVFVALFISALDYKSFRYFAMVFYILSLILLIVVLFKGIGQEQWGSKSWLQVPFIGSFQPSELMKIGTIIFASIYFGKIKDGEKIAINALKAVIIFLLPLGLVFLQPDYGTALVFIFMFILMVFIAGIRYRYMIITAIASIPVFTFAWVFLLNAQRQARILVFLNPDLDPLGSGYHVKQLIKAIGSGQFFGKGLFQGIQTQLGGIPERDTDSIFAVIGEELGFIATFLIVALIFFIIIRSIYIAKKSRDSYGSFMAIGITGMLGFHFIENIGMSMGLLPVTGIPLPFISAGGSSMLTNFIAVGVLLSISMRRKRAIFNQK